MSARAHPRRWTQDGVLRYMGVEVGAVFAQPSGWHFRTFDGRNTELAGEQPFYSSAEAKRALLDHMKFADLATVIRASVEASERRMTKSKA